MDLTTRYLGLELKNPLVASASPLTLDLDNIRRLEDCGAAAVVLPSIFEEQIEAEAAEMDRLITSPGESFAEALSYFPTAIGYRTGPHHYLEIIRRAREAVAIPVIASLNGISRSGWREYARLVEQAGARAIELNVYFIPSELSVSGREVEEAYLDVLRAVKAAVSLPVAMKLSPYFSSPGHVVSALAHAGADGFVLFNRFYQPDIDLVELRLKRDLHLSHPVRDPPAAAVDRRPRREGVRLARREQRSRQRRGGHQISAGRRRCGDDDVFAAALWHRPYGKAPRRARKLARGAGHRIARQRPRQDAAGCHRRPCGLRSRELHQYPAGLHGEFQRAALRRLGAADRRGCVHSVLQLRSVRSDECLGARMQRAARRAVEGFGEVGGIRLRYRIEGEGPWLVLIHGVGNRLEAWDGVVAALGGRFRTLRWDLRGHGASDKPPGPYALDDFVSDLKGLLDAHGIERCHLAGFSLGGLVAQAMALAHPAQLDRLVLLSTVAGRSAEERERVAQRLAMVAHGIPGAAFQELPCALVHRRVPAHASRDHRRARRAQPRERSARLCGRLSRAGRKRPRRPPP